MRSVRYTGFTSASRISLVDPGDLGVGKLVLCFIVVHYLIVEIIIQV